MDEKIAEAVVSLVEHLGISDIVAKGLLEDATALVLDYTNRDTLEPNMLVYTKQLATISYNQEGNEGEASRSEGGVSQTFLTDIPDGIKRSLNKYRLGKVVSYYAPEET